MYNKKTYLALIILLDTLAIHAGFIMAFFIRFQNNLPEENLVAYQQTALWLSIVSIILFYFFELYSNWARKSYHQLMYSVFISVGLMMVFTMAVSFWYREFAFPRSVILLSGVLNLILIGIIHTAVWYAQRLTFGKKKVLIVGQDVNDGLLIANKVLDHNKGWFTVKEFVPYCDHPKFLLSLTQAEVVILSPNIPKDEKVNIIHHTIQQNKEILLVPETYELFMLSAEAQQIDDMPVLSIKPSKLSTMQRTTKRMMDLCLSFMMLAVASPVMIALYVIIPLTSPGSAIFKQERIGLGGRRYQVLKFRSMVNNAEAYTGPVLATQGDSRITKIGHFIRTTRLDELPQLFNVIKGDMSLVGPRPEREHFIDQFKKSIPEYGYRLAVKPGITGLAQVMGKYSTTVEDKLRYDLMYIHNYSFVFDLKILFQTLLVVVQKQKSAGVQNAGSEKEQVLLGLLNISEQEVAAGKEY
ncbi:sugar transferase [Brevibacillus porteri]|uniref:sugar transferase n=1 Tax=Brevibacillus porteri TaxID=2126350 RepID=UPI003633C778